MKIFAFFVDFGSFVGGFGGKMGYVTQKPAVRNSPSTKRLQNTLKCVYICKKF